MKNITNIALLFTVLSVTNTTIIINMPYPTGEDADRKFLRKISLRNEGFMRHIYEAADAALQLRDFYRQVSSPLLADVKFMYPIDQVTLNSAYIIDYSKKLIMTINDVHAAAYCVPVCYKIKQDEFCYFFLLRFEQTL